RRSGGDGSLEAQGGPRSAETEARRAVWWREPALDGDGGPAGGGCAGAIGGRGFWAQGGVGGRGGGGGRDGVVGNADLAEACDTAASDARAGCEGGCAAGVRHPAAGRGGARTVDSFA